MNTVVVVKKHETDSWNASSPTLQAVAKDETSAMQWIQDEVDNKHAKSSAGYMQGKTAAWWVKYGTFSLTTTEVRGS